MPEKRKPPIVPRRVMADDIAVVVGSETYHPHVGEWVEFKGRPSVGLYLQVADAGQSSQAVALLVKNLHAWTLTNDVGVPYPNPPSSDSVMSMAAEEFAWLIQNVSSDGLTEEALKNANTPST